MHDAGMVTISKLVNVANKGDMPKMAKKTIAEDFFEERTIGYNRQYSAKGVKEQVDLLLRIWYAPDVRIGMAATISDSAYDGEYHIDNVAHMTDDNGLRVTEITLSAMEDTQDEVN